MAALTRAVRARTRPPVPGDGAALASLWRQLWDAHERWGGYPGTRDPAVYTQLARRLDDEARARSGRPILGGHVHLVADLGDETCGQVEGWLEPDVAGAPASQACEVRSLVVAERAQRFGVGRALLDALERTARARLRGDACVLVAEVLEPNPAHGFYARTGFAPVAWSVRLEPASPHAPRAGAHDFAARLATPDDALAIARLEATLATRRIAAGDLRFPRPRPVDTRVLASIAARLAGEAGSGEATVVAADPAGVVRGAVSVHVQSLEPPFEPARRGLVGRFALDPGAPAAALVTSLVALGVRLAVSRGAARVELVDLTAPGTPLYDAALACGARPWSRVVIRRTAATKSG